ncbi:tigger transposable element-derived protein 6 [Ixodes scapularis]
MDCSTKLCPFVIGKAQTPRYMKNCPNTPVTYEWNKKACMTRDLFGKWLTDWDAQLADEGCSVCLLVDNCTADHTDVPLSNIKLKFLAPNTTSRLQPLDQGIIRTFKSIYKRRLIKRLLIKLRMNQDLKIDVLGAIQMLKAAWENVKPETIANCFRHGGFVANIEESAEQDGCSEDVDQPDLCELNETWNKFSQFVGEQTFQRQFRFEKSDFPTLVRALDMPESMTSSQGVRISAREALCMYLRRLAYPNRSYDLQEYLEGITQ